MKYIWICLAALLLGLSGYLYYKYYFVFGQGVKAGQLNYAVYKGNLFKTYEGKLIQEGFGGAVQNGGVKSNEFEFSVEDEAVFQQMENNSGKYFELHYKEYHGTLPWRGNSNYVVDRVVNMK